MRLFATPSRYGLPRVSWGAVIAGVILSLIAYLVLSVLGAAIGASLISPMSQPNPTEGFGIGSGIWMLATTIIAVFIGSYFAGRCAPVLGWLHGLLAWAVMVLFVAYGMATVVGGAVHLAGSVASTGATVGAVTSQSQTDGSSMVNSVKRQIQGAVASATSEASSPQAQQEARQAVDAAARAVARATWLSFAALVIGAIIALIAGSLGYRHQPPIEDRSAVARDDAAVDASAERHARPAH
jgi:ABC-type multidrug transport system permease subunit